MAELKIKTTDGNNAVTLAGPASGADVTLKLPTAAGSAGQYLKTDGSNGQLSFDTIAVGGATGTDYNDSVKTRFGTDNDLEIYHDDSNAYLKNSKGNIAIEAKAGEMSVKCIPDGAVEFYHNDAKQCETSANGLAFPSGKGIDFSASGDSTATGESQDSEILDEYEEGEWDITANNNNLTFADPACKYTKVGNLVTCVGKINPSAVSGSDLTYLEMPFVCANWPAHGNTAGSAMIHRSIDAGGDTCGMVMPGNTAFCWLFGSNNDGVWRHISNSHLSTDSEMLFSISYRTA